LTLEQLINVLQQNVDIELERYKEDISRLPDAVRVSGYQKHEFIKVMFTQNKYSKMLVACIMKGGSKVDKRELSSLDKGGSSSWNFLPVKEIEKKYGFLSNCIPAIFLPSDVDFIFVDPRVMRLEICRNVAFLPQILISFNPNLILKQENASVKVISYG
jgi:hypothetical protein